MKKLGKLSHKQRKPHLKNWSITAFKDIKKISKAVCKCKRIPKKALTLLSPHSKTIRKLSNAQPVTVKRILVNQKGGAIFTALAATLIPIIVDQIVKHTT